MTIFSRSTLLTQVVTKTNLIAGRLLSDNEKKKFLSPGQTC
jgi:hypothetical protein